MTAIADLLAQSRHAHQVYRENVPRMIGNGGTRPERVEGDAVLADLSLWQACRLRVEAQAGDPQQIDSAWSDERATHNHDELLAFYGRQLAR